MKRLFLLASAAVLFGTGIVGCSNTSDGMKADAANDTAAVKNAADTAAVKTVKGTEAAGAAVEKGVANAGATVEKGAAEAGAAVQKGAAEAGATVEKGVANAGATVEKGVANAGAAVENAGAAVKKGAEDATDATAKAVGKAGEVATHAGKVVTVTPTVKNALLKDDMLYPNSNPGLNSINVDTGSDGQTIILKGTVQTNEMKKHAEEIAKAASPGGSYKIDNKLTVVKH